MTAKNSPPGQQDSFTGKPPGTHSSNNAPTPQKTRHDQPDEPIGPAEYDTGFTYEDGIKLRQGWAGKHP
ncbi:hypothetical protein JOE56_000023 [Brevibacterium paucivorans]|uniref:Uncharacterized protein n=1 Tax=Brevibacterium paucivorans TaxID=170994 RepID=A0ABS2SH57_9MICO|nr:hypothetical protein [Brevibacterium paucivorans]MBM7815329.1 hypothetical protein [Brevibacterium paucivorans]